MPEHRARQPGNGQKRIEMNGEETFEERLKRLTGHGREELLALLPKCEPGKSWQLLRYPFSVEATAEFSDVLHTWEWRKGRWERKSY